MDKTPQTIKLIRLQSGEDLIAGVTSDEQTVMLDNPMHLVFKRTSVGTVMMMLPWLPIELIKDNMAIIDAADVLTYAEPKDALVEYYGNAINHTQYKMLRDDTAVNNLLKQIEQDDDEILDEFNDEEDIDEEDEVTMEDIKEIIDRKRRGQLH